MNGCIAMCRHHNLPSLLSAALELNELHDARP